MNIEPSEAGTARADAGHSFLNRERLLRWCAVIRSLLTGLTFTYVVGFLLLLAGLEWVGERFWPFGILLYAPPQIFLLPLLVLMPLCLLFRWRLCLWHLGGVAFLFLVYQPLRFAPPSAPVPGEVSVVTFNQGQADHAQFLAFVAEKKPDFILVQDVQWSLRDFRTKFPDYLVAGVGEFVLVSKFPILRSAIVEQPRDGFRPIAARFEVFVHGQPLAIYSVHITTPRQQLSRFLGGSRVIRDLVGLGNRKAVAGDYRAWLAKRRELARNLTTTFAGEKLPYLAGGDFNTPDHGYIYHLFAGKMTDAFAAAGRGWGLTFPGTMRHPVAFFDPWLRIDYLFAGRGWRPVECRPEKGHQSEHRAVFARFAPADS